MTTGYRQPVIHTMVTTGFELDNFRVVRNLGVVARDCRAISRSVFGTIGAKPANPGRWEYYAPDELMREHSLRGLRAHAAPRFLILGAKRG